MSIPDFVGMTDEEFESAWFFFPLEDKEELPDSIRGECFRRYRRLTPHIDQTIDRAARGARFLDEHQAEGKKNGGNGEHGPRARSPLDWPALEARGIPPLRRWATASWFGFGHVTLMVGAGGIGKTLCAQQWASALTLGHSFIGDAIEPLRCLMWACEDDHDELWRRQLAIAQWLKVGLSAFEGLVIEPRQGLDNTLASTEYGRLMFSPLIGELTEQANDYHAEVVIVDNAAQTYGGNENDRHSVTAFLNNLVGALPGRAVMLLAHPSRAQGSEYSGSSAWEAVARTRLYLGRTLPDEKDQGEDTKDDTVRYLARRKANYSARDYRRFEFSNGVLNQDMTEGADGLLGRIKSEKAARVVIDGLRKLTGMGLRTIDARNSPDYLPRVLKDYKLMEGVSQAELTDAMRSAIASGSIERGEIGTLGNRHKLVGLIAK